MTDLDTPSLARLGVRPEDHTEIARRALQSSSMRGNPVELDHDDLLAILTAAHDDPAAVTAIG